MFIKTKEWENRFSPKNTGWIISESSLYLYLNKRLIGIWKPSTMLHIRQKSGGDRHPPPTPERTPLQEKVLQQRRPQWKRFSIYNAHTR